MNVVTDTMGYPSEIHSTLVSQKDENVPHGRVRSIVLSYEPPSEQADERITHNGIPLSACLLQLLMHETINSGISEQCCCFILARTPLSG
jgi:hypothetical protein